VRVAVAVWVSEPEVAVTVTVLKRCNHGAGPVEMCEESELCELSLLLHGRKAEPSALFHEKKYELKALKESGVFCAF
jgi:hypothetical protein